MEWSRVPWTPNQPSPNANPLSHRSYFPHSHILLLLLLSSSCPPPLPSLLTPLPSSPPLSSPPPLSSLLSLPDQDLDEQGRENHRRVARVVDFLAAQGYLVKMTAATASATATSTATAPGGVVATLSSSVDKPLGTVEEGTASGVINEVRTIEDSLASVDL